MTIDPASPIVADAIERCSPLRALPGDVRAELIASMTERSFADGELLMRQGEIGDCLMLVLEGQAKAVLNDRRGAHEIATFTRGDVVGEMALLTGGARSADVCATSTLRCLSLTARDLRELASRRPQVAVVLTNLVADRLGAQPLDGLGGKELGGYRIRRCIGRGGMAVVYEAEHVKRRDRVALKMMSHRLIYEHGALESFQREAKTLLALDHPHITRIRDQFAAFGTSFIAMELCEGADLAKVSARCGPLPEKTVRCILGQLASALHHLHELGVTHRDLKPSNVLFSKTGTLKLTDFGLAAPTRSRPSMFALGTPLYLPPEGFAGEGDGVSTDLYALGCLLYELLIGRPLFGGSDLLEVFEKKRTFAMPPRKAFGVAISRRMHRLIATLLSHDPGKRGVRLHKLARRGRDLDLALCTAS